MNSILRLFTKPGFTEASAKEANRLLGNLVTAIQRAVKRIVEREIYDSLLESLGIDPAEADVRFNWGIPEKPKITLEDIQRFYSTPPHVEPALTRSEVRKLLKNLGFPITEEAHESAKIIESAESVVIRLRESEAYDLRSAKDLVIDRDRGIHLTLIEGADWLKVAAITFDKKKWPKWNSRNAQKWFEENFETIKSILGDAKNA